MCEKRSHAGKSPDTKKNKNMKEKWQTSPMNRQKNNNTRKRYKKKALQRLKLLVKMVDKYEMKFLKYGCQKVSK